ncbi:preprotein translocase subunit SecE [bacterium]|jgi:preprotein translocase subunit SecE|nr:preprotein translocase subunit SecE [bacterium]MDP6571746.1 preprotein translocase subunit SecE [Patescibacteria group bacterium]MDP6756543.1 preprotein translocase subunit SecE [Patescibacteria group bacterium]|tara:strand:+ start:2083 stop:2268 length:186 start_codon:yes stop_codon:yes gene_type:complete
MHALVQYLRNSRQELRKVTWPSKEKTINDTILVVAVSIAIAAFLGAADYGLSNLLEFLLAI